MAKGAAFFFSPAILVWVFGVVSRADVSPKASLLDVRKMWRWPYTSTNPRLYGRYIISRRREDHLPDFTFWDDHKNFTNSTLACPHNLVKNCLDANGHRESNIGEHYVGGMFCDAEKEAHHPVGDNSAYYIPNFKKIGLYRPAINRTRRNILQRAIGWLAFHIPYNGVCGSSHFKWSIPETCAEDDVAECPQYSHTSVCNGLVNMAWGVPSTELGVYSEKIDCADVKPGDQVAFEALHGGLSHQFLFRRWLGKPLSRMKIYQMGGEHGATNVAELDFPPLVFCNETKRTRCYKCSRYLHVVEKRFDEGNEEDDDEVAAESMVVDTAAADSTESLFDDNLNIMWRWPYNATNPGLVNRFIIPRKSKDGYPDYYFYDKNRNFSNDTLACPPQLLKTAVYSKTPKCTIKGLMFCDMERHENHPIWAKRKYYVPHYKAVGENRPAINRTRRNILQRAIGWLAFHVPYGGQCHSSTFKWTVPETCAEDDNPSCPQYTHTSVCNGLVNMAWGVPNTILGKYSEHINCTDLRPGDQVALNARKGGLAHQFIFRNWVKKPLGNMRVYQMGGEHGAANVDTLQFPPRKFCTDTLKTKCYKCSRYLRVIEDGEQTSVAVL